MTGYQEQHLKRLAASYNAPIPVDPPAILTDRTTYLNFLETQLERVSAACMSVAQYDQRFKDMESLIVKLESRCSNNTKLAEINQSTTMKVKTDLDGRLGQLTEQVNIHNETYSDRLDISEKRIEEAEEAIIDLSVLPAQVKNLELRATASEEEFTELQTAYNQYVAANDAKVSELDDRSNSTQYRVEKIFAQVNALSTSTSESETALKYSISNMEARLKDIQAEDRQIIQSKLEKLDTSRINSEQQLQTRIATEVTARTEATKLVEKQLQSFCVKQGAAIEEKVSKHHENNTRQQQKTRTALQQEIASLSNEMLSMNEVVTAVTTSCKATDTRVNRINKDVEEVTNVAYAAEKHASKAVEALAKFKPLVTALATQQQMHSKSQKRQLKSVESVLNRLDKQDEALDDLQANTAAAAFGVAAYGPAPQSGATHSLHQSHVHLLHEAYTRAQGETEALRNDHIKLLFEQHEDVSPFDEQLEKSYEEGLRSATEKEAHLLQLLEEAAIVASSIPGAVTPTVPVAAAAEGTASDESKHSEPQTTAAEVGAGAGDIPASDESKHSEPQTTAAEAGAGAGDILVDVIPASTSASDGRVRDPSQLNASTIAAAIEQTNIDSSSSNSGEVGHALRDFLKEYESNGDSSRASPSSRGSKRYAKKSGLTLKRPKNASFRQPSRMTVDDYDMEYLPVRGVDSQGRRTGVSIRGNARSRFAYQMSQQRQRARSNSPQRRINQQSFSPRHKPPKSKAEQETSDARRTNKYAQSRLDVLNESFGQNMQLPSLNDTTINPNTSLSGIIVDPLQSIEFDNNAPRVHFVAPHFSQVRQASAVWLPTSGIGNAKPGVTEKQHQKLQENTQDIAIANSASITALRIEAMHRAADLADEAMGLKQGYDRVAHLPRHTSERNYGSSATNFRTGHIFNMQTAKAATANVYASSGGGTSGDNATISSETSSSSSSALAVAASALVQVTGHRAAAVGEKKPFKMHH